MAVLQNEIYIGSLEEPLYFFDNNSIANVEGEMSCSIVNENLAFDTFTPIVKYIKTGENDIEELVYGTPVLYYIGTRMIGRFYIKNIERTSKYLYKLNCVSGVGLLSRMKHYGGLYLTSNRYIDVLKSILQKDPADPDSGSVFEFSVDESIENIRINGYLPYSTKRDNLYQFLLATNTNIITDLNCNYVFTAFRSGQSSEIIQPNDIYDEGSVDYGSSPSKITITKHGYRIKTTQTEEVIFDNSDDILPLVDKLVEFSSSPIDLTSIRFEGSLTSSYTNENVAKVSGIGKIFGIPYTHDEDEVEEEDPSAYEDKNISVNDCTLITENNIGVVSERLFAYYKNAKNITNGIKLIKEKCGNKYMFIDPFEDNRTGIITKMTLTTDAIIKASCNIMVDWNPSDYPIPDPDPTPHPHPYAGKHISFLGDDMTSFKDYIPSGSDYTYYYDGTNCYVTSVNQTWWKHLIDRTGMLLSVNNSISESCCCTGVNQKIAACEDSRINGLKENTSDPDPNIIIVYVGLNDYLNGVDLGKYDGTGPIPSTTTTFREAYGVMLNKLKTKYPLTKIYCCTLQHTQTRSTKYTDQDVNYKDVPKTDFDSAIKQIAQALNITVIDFNSCGIDMKNLPWYCGDDATNEDDIPNEGPYGRGWHSNADGHMKLYKAVAKEFDD